MNTENTKTRTITIAKKDVYFDIDYLSMSYADASGGERPERDDRVATESDEASQNREIKRMCDHRFSDVRSALHKHLDAVTASTANTTLSASDWSLTLRVSTEVEDNVLDTIADKIHEYIMTGALHDWYAHIGVNGNREALQNRAENALKSIRELIYYKPMP